MAAEPQSESDRPTPSEYVRLEADLSTRPISKSVWVNQEATPHRPVVLVVEANADRRARAAAKLGAPVLGKNEPAFRVRTADDAERAAAVIESYDIDLILCGRLSTATDEQRLNEVLLQDARFSRGVRFRLTSTRDTTAAGVLPEPIHLRLVGEVLADLAEGLHDRAPPGGER